MLGNNLVKTSRIMVCGLLLLACWSTPSLRGQQPAKLSPRSIESLKQDGDRLADQGDFLGALEKYTTAYLGVVSGIRGQDFSENVVPNIYNREELGKEMLQMMKEEYTAEELELMDSSYKAFDLIPRDMDSQKLITQLLTEEVAGFYDPAKKRMVLIVEDGSVEEPTWLGKLFGAKSAFDKDEQKTTLAHELTHALQDQLYGLRDLQKRIEKDDDMATAFSALVEGDATLLMFVEMGDTQDVRDMDPDAMRATFNIMSFMLPLAGGDAYRKAPPIFRDTLIFPYFQGMIFALTAARENGWEGIHRIYSNPPVSTEQILHPAKYLDPAKLDMPQAVAIPELTAIVGDDWKHLGGNVLGELQTSILLKRVVGGRQASEGWDGDRYEVFKSSSGELGLVSVSIWDSERDAQEFAEAFRKYRTPVVKRGKRLPPAPSAEATIESAQVEVAAELEANVETAADSADASGGSAEDAVAGSEEAGQHVPRLLTLEVHADQVWIVEGFSAETRAAIVSVLGQCEFTEKIFPAATPAEKPPTP